MRHDAIKEWPVTYEIECYPEEIEIEGNASAVDPETDKETYDWIHKELDRGNQWAWAWVKVLARCGDFEGSAAIGGCSFESEKDFDRCYGEDMRREALADLKVSLEREIKRAKEAQEILAALPD
jgi:hypothetical protein